MASDSVRVLPEILKNLKCSECNAYLSVAPIAARYSGETLCGRCVEPELVGTSLVRMHPYEQLGAMMSFPCRYEAVGCAQAVAWSAVGQHEATCVYRPTECPLLPPARCPWIGPTANLLQHYRTQHPLLYLAHPANITIPADKDRQDNMLTTVFNQLFLVQVKYLAKSGKIWLTVRILSSPDAAHYKYSVTLIGDDEEIMKKRPVESRNSLYVLQHATHELPLLSATNDNKIHLTVRIKCTQPLISNAPAVQIKRICKYENCGYKDISENVDKHERWFCPASELCCNKCNSYFKYVLNHMKYCYLYQHGRRSAAKLSIWEHNLIIDSNGFENNDSAIILYNNHMFFVSIQHSTESIKVQVVSSLHRSKIGQYILKFAVYNSKEREYCEQTVEIGSAPDYYDWTSILIHNTTESTIPDTYDLVPIYDDNTETTEIQCKIIISIFAKPREMVRAKYGK